jgi:hypothetical protein
MLDQLNKEAVNYIKMLNINPVEPIQKSINEALQSVLIKQINESQLLPDNVKRHLI